MKRIDVPIMYKPSLFPVCSFRNVYNIYMCSTRSQQSSHILTGTRGAMERKRKTPLSTPSLESITRRTTQTLRISPQESTTCTFSQTVVRVRVQSRLVGGTYIQSVLCGLCTRTTDLAITAAHTTRTLYAICRVCGVRVFQICAGIPMGRTQKCDMFYRGHAND